MVEEHQELEKIELKVSASPSMPDANLPALPSENEPITDGSMVKHQMLHNAPMARQCTSNWDDMTGSYCRQCAKCGLTVLDLNDPQCPPVDRVLLNLREKNRFSNQPLYRRGDGRYVYGDCFARRNAGAAYAAFVIGTMVFGGSYARVPPFPYKSALYTAMILWYGLGNYLITRTVNGWKITMISIVFLLAAFLMPMILLTPWAVPLAQTLGNMGFHFLALSGPVALLPPVLAWLFFLWLIILRNPNLTRFDKE